MASIGNWAYVFSCKLGVAAARNRPDRLKVAHRVRHLGDAYRYAGRSALAEECYVEALVIYRGDPQTRPLDLANAIRSFAVLRQETGAVKDAERLWHEAHELYVALSVPAGVAESAARLGLLARRQGGRATQSRLSGRGACSRR